MLSWFELSDVVLEVEAQLNRRSWSYVEPCREENLDLRKRAKHLKPCKDALWKRWTREYLTALRERHRRGKERKLKPLNIGDVVIIHSEEKNRAASGPLGLQSSCMKDETELYERSSYVPVNPSWQGQFSTCIQ